ncbi:MAG: hypothetical protein JSV44_01735 [Candidatus Zixiibacteriota bacterium]|nr:MAG: hypothetical protein JSV44_01735 [candidate division Zixibacteria bacterium]
MIRAAKEEALLNDFYPAKLPPYGRLFVRLFCALMLLMFTSYSAKTRRFFYWLLAVPVSVHVIGITGHGFCWPAGALLYFYSTLALAMLVVMTIMIPANLKGKV